MKDKRDTSSGLADTVDRSFTSSQTFHPQRRAFKKGNIAVKPGIDRVRRRHVPQLSQRRQHCPRERLRRLKHHLTGLLISVMPARYERCKRRRDQSDGRDEQRHHNDRVH